MPVDKIVVEQQIKALGRFTTYGATKEIEQLPKILADGETILGLSRGVMDNKTWLITVTPLLAGAKAAASAVGIADDHLIVLVPDGVGLEDRPYGDHRLVD